jgi:hypothetical protein
VYLYQQVPGVMHATTLEGVGAFNRLSSVQARGKSHDLNAEEEDAANEIIQQKTKARVIRCCHLSPFAIEVVWKSSVNISQSGESLAKTLILGELN